VGETVVEIKMTEEKGEVWEKVLGYGGMEVDGGQKWRFVKPEEEDKTIVLEVDNV
jgi:hypothetical protein